MNNEYSKNELDHLNDLFFEAGYLFCEFENTPAEEKERWFHLFIKDAFTEEDLNQICKIMSEQVAELDLICDFNYHNEYTNYDEIYVRRK